MLAIVPLGPSKATQEKLLYAEGSFSVCGSNVLISEQSFLTNTNPDRSNSGPNPASSQQLALTLATAADDRKGADILILNVRDVSYLADFFVIVTGFSRTQVRALADSMQKAAVEQCHRTPVHVEGQTDSNWIVLDYGDAIAHIMMPEARQFYSLEAFWGHAERLSFPTTPTLK
jgi:ribosome-associated protein